MNGNGAASNGNFPPFPPGAPPPPPPEPSPPPGAGGPAAPGCWQLPGLLVRLVFWLALLVIILWMLGILLFSG